MSKSIKENFVFNVINSVTGMLFPLITFPYASRVLLAEGIGEVNFFASIINYIVLFTGLGIPIYGIREIARVRDNKCELTRTLVEILSLNLLLCCIGFVVVAVMCFAIPEIRNNSSLFLVLSSLIIFTPLGCTWFYSGIEEFKQLAVRSLVIRCLSLIILFTLVRSKDDILYYGVFTVVTNVGSNIINFACLRKHIEIRRIQFKELNIFKHVRPAFAVFIFSIVSSIYLNLDKVMLGFIRDSTAVGYYTAASQISHILLTLVVSLGSVLLPRSSNLIENNQMDDFFRLTEKSYHFILMLSFPIVAGCLILAPSLIHIICGESYEPAIRTLILICPIILIIGISQLIGMQFFYPLGKIKFVTRSTCIGALVNLLLNAILIPLYAQDGAAISSVAAELSVTITLGILAKKVLPFELISSKIVRYLVSTLIMAVVCYMLISFVQLTDWVSLIVIPIVGALIYFVTLLIAKDQIALEIISVTKNQIKRYI